jgi:hypothetical protein
MATVPGNRFHASDSEHTRRNVLKSTDLRSSLLHRPFLDLLVDISYPKK